METRNYYIHALSGLHMGTGQGTGVIDLPLAREKSTGLPIVPGSGMKGVLRDQCYPSDNNNLQLWEVLFGPESKELKDKDGFAGAIAVQDARLLCLPVRSVKGVFAWVSCPFILHRFFRDSGLLVGDDSLSVPAVVDNEAVVGENCQLVFCENEIFLEDLTFTKKDSEDVTAIAKIIAEDVFPEDGSENFWQNFFKERFMVVSDGVFSFLADTATEIQARIKLKKDTKTVEKGGLWYEENLPAETILHGILGCSRSRNDEKYEGDGKELMNQFMSELVKGSELHLQIGGNATVGRGNVRWIVKS